MPHGGTLLVRPFGILTKADKSAATPRPARALSPRRSTFKSRKSINNDEVVPLAVPVSIPPEADHKIHLTLEERNLAKASFYRIDGMSSCEQISDALRQEFGFYILPEMLKSVLMSGLRKKDGGFNAVTGTGVMRMSQWYTLLGYLKFSTDLEAHRCDVRDAFEALGGDTGDVDKAVFIASASAITPGVDISHRISEICGDEDTVPLRFENFSRDLMMFGKKSNRSSMAPSVAEVVHRKSKARSMQKNKADFAELFPSGTNLVEQDPASHNASLCESLTFAIPELERDTEPDEKPSALIVPRPPEVKQHTEPLPPPTKKDATGEAPLDERTTIKFIPISLEERIYAMYHEFNPSKLSDLPNVLIKYEGHEIALLHALIRKYGQEPHVAFQQANKTTVYIAKATMSPRVPCPTLNDANPHPAGLPARSHHSGMTDYERRRRRVNKKQKRKAKGELEAECKRKEAEAAEIKAALFTTYTLPSLYPPVPPPLRHSLKLKPSAIVYDPSPKANTSREPGGKGFISRIRQVGTKMVVLTAHDKYPQLASPGAMYSALCASPVPYMPKIPAPVPPVLCHSSNVKPSAIVHAPSPKAKTNREGEHESSRTSSTSSRNVKVCNDKYPQLASPGAMYSALCASPVPKIPAPPCPRLQRERTVNTRSPALGGGEPGCRV